MNWKSLGPACYGRNSGHARARGWASDFSGAAEDGALTGIRAPAAKARERLCVISIRTEWTRFWHLADEEYLTLRDALLTQDCIPVRELEPFRMNLADATLDREWNHLAVSLRSGDA